MKKKMIVLIAFIYIASMLFCGDGVGKKFVEEKFPHLTYSDKECDDSKKKELRIVEDEDTAGGILSYEELAAMEKRYLLKKRLIKMMRLLIYLMK